MTSITSHSGQVNVKQAAAIAAQGVADLLSGEVRSPVRLEEVQMSEDGSKWLITVSFLRERPSDEKTIPSPLLAAFNLEPALKGMKVFRDYKLVTVDASTGNFESMRIRAL